VILLLGAPARAGDLESGIDKLVTDAGVTSETPGVAVLIIDTGKVVCRKGYGLARLKDKAPFTPQTTCEIASMAKMFTATAVMILVDRGKLGLSDPVRKYMPELPEYYEGKPVTITHLLQHTSGLPDYLRFPQPMGKHAGYVTNEDYAGEFARLKDKFPAPFEPGAQFRYNNTNYMLLALIIERVTKQSFGHFLKADVLQPLGMNASWVYESPQSAPKAHPKSAPNAVAYAKKKNGWEEGWGSPPFRDESLLTVGDGGLWTSLDDLARFDEGLRASKLIKPDTMKLAHQRSKTADGKTNGYGFGLTVTYRGDRLVGIGHGGSWIFQTTYYRDLAHDLSVIMLSNREELKVGQLHQKIEALLEK
jgi:CubicO group peptidase (beta-lactamase class C family)